jgi:hypothetical protein
MLEAIDWGSRSTEFMWLDWRGVFVTSPRDVADSGEKAPKKRPAGDICGFGEERALCEGTGGV